MSQDAAAKPAGVIVVDKPMGWTSMDVIRRLRRAAGGGKCGHAGTLDPLATGVLVCCIGKATREVPRLMGMVKVYEAEIDFSAFTTTDDREGARTEVPGDAVAEGRLREVMAEFVGVIAQKPPAFSAVKVGGKRAYKMARAGKPVEITARPVRIDAVELLGYAWPVARVRVTCGKGTYIRSLARDIGTRLGRGGHLASLRRLSVGPFDLARAVTVERLKEPVTQADLISVAEL